MAAGTPVIATKLGSTGEVIDHGKTGFLCNTIEECVSAIDKAAALDRYACREYVGNRFGVKQMTDGYEAVYRQIVAERLGQRNGHLRGGISLANTRII
jgi:glycosyltransferase involved in cell wall biosynthesis